MNRSLLSCLFAAVLGIWPMPGESQTPALVKPPDSGDGQHWFAGRQLPDLIRLDIVGVDEDRCGSEMVVFRTGEPGRPSPDTVPGVWEDGRCTAAARWNLSGAVGRQHMKASLVSLPARLQVFEASARQGARVFFGVGYTPQDDAHTVLETFSDTALVVSGDTTRIVVKDSATVRRIGSRAQVRPIIGVDFPIWPSVERVRLSMGTSAKELDEFFYFGFSVLQAFVFGPSRESAAFDVHLGMQLSRRELGVEGSDCAPARACTRSELRIAGLAVLLTVDSASAFRGIASAILR